MTSTAGGSPLVVAALALIGRGATTTDLEQRFAEGGADLRPGEAERLLNELASLGLIRVSRGSPVRQYVLSSLGHKLVDNDLWRDASVPLKDLERLRTDLLSTIAHELRTPLTVVRTSTGLLLDPASNPTVEQRRAMLETIERNAERMQRLISDILDLARFRSGAIRLQLRNFGAVALAESVIATIRPLAEQRGQHIELRSTTATGPRVFGDHPRLERALLNLVSNAQRFTPDGGSVEVRVRTAPGDRICWTVTDPGPGIAVDDQAHLFERFFVGRNDRNEAHQGVGLGLPTALAIAQAHGGTIEVDSYPGRGSTFTLIVPSDGPPGDA
jgi:signal transduction histidine kinase